jgi:hypothetical protein
METPNIFPTCGGAANSDRTAGALELDPANPKSQNRSGPARPGRLSALRVFPQ